MRVELKEPFVALSGVVTGINPDNLNERYYFYTKRQTEKVFLKKCPNQKKLTKKQIENQQRFGELYGKGRRIERNDPQPKH